jgi:hypothetical protein
VLSRWRNETEMETELVAFLPLIGPPMRNFPLILTQRPPNSVSACSHSVNLSDYTASSL